jgi:hypothetical protein
MSFKDYLGKGPVDIPRALGVRHVNPTAAESNEFYDKLSQLQRDMKDWREDKREGKKGGFDLKASYKRFNRTALFIGKLRKRIDVIKNNSDLDESEKQKRIDNINRIIKLRIQKVLNSKAAQF